MLGSSFLLFPRSKMVEQGTVLSLSQFQGVAKSYLGEGTRMVEPPVTFKSKGSNLKIKITNENTMLSSKEIWSENSGE